MQVERVLVAADGTPEGRHAIRFACRLTRALEANLTILRVFPVPADGAVPAGSVGSTVTGGANVAAALAAFRTWLGPVSDDSGAAPARRRPAPEVAVAFGVPGIEIGRATTARDAGLVVLGRRARGNDAEVRLGRTADAVVRRAAQPVLFVPAEVEGIGRILVALDRSDRALHVLEGAVELATRFGASLSAVTVESPPGHESPAGSRGALPQGRAIRLGDAVRRVAGDFPEPPSLTTRSGDPVREVLAECVATGADALVIGYRRGGPAQVIRPSDTARRLLYAAPCAVYTVPL